jgi:hypothetical protein
VGNLLKKELVGIRMPVVLIASLDSLAEEEGRDRTKMALILLLEALEARGIAVSAPVTLLELIKGERK